MYGYCRHPKLVNLLKAPLVPLIPTFSAQELLDGISFLFRRERFQGDACDWAEPLFRQALQEVVRRVRSEHPPRFLAVTRQDYWLMRGNTRLGVLTPSASLNGVLSSQFAADAAFAPIHPCLRRHTIGWKRGRTGGIGTPRIHEAKASFYLSKELLMRH